MHRFFSWQCLLYSTSTTTVVSSSATAAAVTSVVVLSPLLSIFTATPPTTAASKGLDPSVIRTIPTFFYSSKAGRFPQLECAVCSPEFKNDEKARVLPRCNHTFHVDCIDTWLYSLSNCPLCRAPVIADIPDNPPMLLEQTNVAVAESAYSEPPRENIETTRCPTTASPSSLPSSSSSPSSLQLENCPMKTQELAGREFLWGSPRATASSSSLSSSSSSSPSSLELESCPMKTYSGAGILVDVPTTEYRLTGVIDVGSVMGF